MCELFAMSASRPTGVGGPLSLLKPRGGLTGPHGDGWGVAYFEGRAARIHKEPAAAADSQFLSLLADDDLRSSCVIAHIRRANPSTYGRATANTHPFEREWNGRSWVFAHNGKLPALKAVHPIGEGRFRPLGETDSEHAFCLIMNTLARALPSGDMPSPEEVTRLITPMVGRFSAMGEFNFLLGHGDHLYAHAHTRLHALRREEVDRHGESRTVTLLATQPLTEDQWQPLAPGVVQVYAGGREITPLPWPLRRAA